MSKIMITGTLKTRRLTYANSRRLTYRMCRRLTYVNVQETDLCQ
jgi:hypothetical protein